MSGFPFFDIFLLAMIAAFIVVRLRSVLGRRTGNERPPQNRFAQRDVKKRANGAEHDGNVVRLPGRGPAAPSADVAVQMGAIEKIAPAGSPVADGLMEVQTADRFFDPEQFLQGAKSAYEMIVDAFCAGDRKSLRPLLADEVYESFDSAIGSRERELLTVESDFVGIEKAEIVAAALKEKIAEITVRFISEVISVTKNADGAVVEGDPNAVRRVTDIWTFARDTHSGNLNWELVGTAAGS